jgi:L-lactate dehydrogenase complex protein LldG
VNSRDLILERVRRNQPASRALPEVPTFDRALSSPFEAYCAALERMGGRVTEAPRPGGLDALVRGLFPDARVFASATPEFVGTRTLQPSTDPRELHDVDVGVVRARCGVAETGSALLSETETIVNAIAFLSQHLVVLLDPASIVPNLHHAYRDPLFHRARYAVLMTGPSATADIEGVLIRGAQGVRSFTVVPMPGPSA